MIRLLKVFKILVPIVCTADNCEGEKFLLNLKTTMEAEENRVWQTGIGECGLLRLTEVREEEPGIELSEVIKAEGRSA